MDDRELHDRLTEAEGEIRRLRQGFRIVWGILLFALAHSCIVGESNEQRIKEVAKRVESIR